MVRGVRGATTIPEDNSQEVIRATQELLTALLRENDIEVGDVVSAVFTVTSDVTSQFPALAARMMGWTQVPLMCGQEMEVAGALPRCIRVLLHINTVKSQPEIRHIYLHEASKLREDLA